MHPNYKHNKLSLLIYMGCAEAWLPALVFGLPCPLLSSPQLVRSRLAQWSTLNVACGSPFTSLALFTAVSTIIYIQAYPPDMSDLVVRSPSGLPLGGPGLLPGHPALLGC